jgi:uncharacterized membrane protein (UPF0127 family)
MNDLEIFTIKVDDMELANRVVCCLSSGSRRAGLLGKKRLSREEGVLIVMPARRRGGAGLTTSIHMLGMRFSVAAAWLDDSRRVVHAVLARPWRPYYASPRPASYVLELHPDHLARLAPGAQVKWTSSRSG